MRILLVDDHVLFREGLVGLLNGQPDFEVIGQAGTVAEAVRLCLDLQPDLILMDFSLPDGTGLDATQAILAELPRTKIVFLTVHAEDERLFSAIRCGAKGYLLKNVPVDRLLPFLRGAEKGEAAILPQMTSRLLVEFARMEAPRTAQPDGVSELTTREMEVLQELTTGATNREIADRLFVSENTIKNHVRSILNKLNLENRRQAAHFARCYDLVSG